MMKPLTGSYNHAPHEWRNNEAKMCVGICFGVCFVVFSGFMVLILATVFTFWVRVEGRVKVKVGAGVRVRISGWGLGLLKKGWVDGSVRVRVRG